MARTPALEIHALPDFPLVQSGDDLGAQIEAGIKRLGRGLEARDIVVVAQKVVSKAEGRFVDLGQIAPTERARRLAAEVGKDPRLVEVILSESVRVVRHRANLLIMQHRLGFVMANAGVDHSNLGPPRPGQPEASADVLLLPADPDASAERLRVRLAARFAVPVAVVINDSFGRAWRRGTCGVAIGVAGLPALVDLRGKPDLFGRTLEVSVVGLADEVAAAASLVQGQAQEGQPVVLIRGLRWSAPEGTAAALARPAEEDLFR